MFIYFFLFDEEDCLLCFGQMVFDYVIENYVCMIDFGCDIVFGVFDYDFELIGVGYLVYLLVEGDKCMVEFGVLVFESVCGCGVGLKLFECVVICSCNMYVMMLYMYCLLCNVMMMYIVKKFGM